MNVRALEMCLAHDTPERRRCDSGIARDSCGLRDISSISKVGATVNSDPDGPFISGLTVGHGSLCLVSFETTRTPKASKPHGIW